MRRTYRTLRLATPFNLNDAEGVERHIEQTRNAVLDALMVPLAMIVFLAIYCLLP